MYNQSDVIAVKFPFTDGSEFKKRPALIVSNEMVNSTGDYLIVQITSKQNSDNLSLPINHYDCLQALPLKSFIRTHKIFTIHESLILSKITSVTPTFLDAVTKQICSLMK